MEHLWTAKEVAAFLRVPPSWVYEQARRGRLPHILLGRYRRFRSDDVRAFADDHRR